MYISESVLDELSAAPSRLVEEFQRILVGFSDKYFDDALHIAIASVHRIDYLLSWNFKHIVKVRTRKLVSLVIR